MIVAGEKNIHAASLVQQNIQSVHFILTILLVIINSHDYYCTFILQSSERYASIRLHDAVKSHYMVIENFDFITDCMMQF